MTLFQGPGLAVLIYTAYSALVGRVYAKAGAVGRVVERTDSPVYFWVVVSVYAALSIALLTVF